MPIASINQISLYYEVYGEGEPLLLVHGFASNHTVWAMVTAALSQYYQVITFDNRGSGQSSHPDYPYTMDLMVDDILGLMKHLNIEQAHVLGHSMGGMLAQVMAYKYPTKINKLIIQASSSQLQLNIANLFKTHLKLHQAGIDRRLLTELMFPNIFSAQFYQDPEMVAGLIELSYKYPYPITVSGYKNQLAALLEFNSKAYLADIKHDCLVLAGEEDIMTPLRDSQYLVEHITNAELITFAHTGHAIHIQSPVQYLETVTQFLRD